MARDNRDDETDNEDYTTVSAMASRLKLKGRERDRYIDEHMRGLGYKAVASYVRPDDDDDDDDSGGRRFRIGRGQRGGRGDDDNWP